MMYGAVVRVTRSGTTFCCYDFSSKRKGIERVYPTSNVLNKTLRILPIIDCPLLLIVCLESCTVAQANALKND